MMKNNSHNELSGSDVSLWERFRRNDPDAFLHIYDEYADLLYSFGMNFTKDKELIKDCIHDLFLELYKYRDRLSGTSSIRFYLFASLKRKIIREQQKKGSILSFDPSVLPLVGKEESPDQEYAFIRQEEADHGNKLLLEAFGKLTGHQQEILLLRFNQELSYPEIAELFQISVETVRTLVYRSLKIIRSFLQESDCTFPILFLLMRPVNSCLKVHRTSLV